MIRRFFAHGLAANLVILSLAPPLWSAEPDAFQFFEEEAKVVTASKKAEGIQEAPGVMSVITSEEIRQYGARNLRDVIDRAPSVYTLNGTLHPDNVVSMRGDSQSQLDTHVLWLLDGRPVRDVVFGGIDSPLLTSYPVELVDHIEIVRGPGSVLYGSNAYTGVINIITKKALVRQAAVQTGGGSYDTGYGTLSGGVPLNDGGSVTGAGRYYRTAGWRYSAKDEGRVDSSMRMKTEDTSFALNSRYHDWVMTGFYADTHQLDMGTLPRWPADATNDLKGMFDLGYKHAIAEDWSAGANATYNFSRLNATNPGNIGADQTGTSLLGEATIQGTPLRDLNIVLGGNGDYQKVDFDPEEEHPRQTNWAMYAQADYRPVSLLKLVGGAQYNKSEGVSANTSPRGGAILTFNPNWGGKLLYGEAFRSPYLAETQLDNAALRGNPNLTPETIRTFDAQLFNQSQKVHSSLTFFHSYQKDRIVRVVDNGVTTYANSGDLTSQGVELEATVNPVARLSLIGSYLYQTNWNQNDVHDATFMPNNMLKTGVSYAADAGVTVGVFNTYFGQRGDVNAINPRALEINPPSRAYNWLTANVSFDLEKLLKRPLFSGTTLSLYAVNLLNEQVFDPENNRDILNTVPARAGRSLYGEFRVKFGGKS